MVFSFPAAGAAIGALLVPIGLVAFQDSALAAKASTQPESARFIPRKEPGKRFVPPKVTGVQFVGCEGKTRHYFITLKGGAELVLPDARTAPSELPNGVQPRVRNGPHERANRQGHHESTAWQLPRTFQAEIPSPEHLPIGRVAPA